MLLKDTNDIEVCGEAVDGQDAVVKAAELNPDELEYPAYTAIGLARLGQRRFAGQAKKKPRTR
jgi:hypothetical protein